MGLKDGAGLEQWEIAVTKKILSEYRRRLRYLQPEDFEDLQQECLLHWIQVRARLTPTGNAPPVAYMSQVLRNKLTDWTREQLAEKRGGDQEHLSLDAAVDDMDGGITLGDLIGDATPSQAGWQESADQRNAEIDVTRAFAYLSASQQKLCAMLGSEGLSVKEAAERLQIPRGTLYEELKRIRKIFSDHGLGDYLNE